MMKRLLTVLMVIAMTLSMVAMAGCGDKATQTGTSSTGGGKKSASEEEFFMDMPAELKGTTVKFATWIDHTQTDTAAVLAGFEETTGMKCELVHIAQGEYITKLSGLIASGQSPDVVVDNREFPRTLKLLMPLEKETTGLDVTDPFWNQQLVDIYTIGKYTYLVNGAHSSWDIAGGCTYFNRTLLEDNGIKTPSEYVDEDNWNLNTFYTLMSQAKKGCKLTGAPADVALDVFTAMYNTREVTLNTETDHFENTAQNDQMVEALKFLLEARTAGLLQICVGESSGNFTSGNAVMEICGAYGLRNKPGWFYDMDINDLGVTVLPKINASDSDYPYTTFPRSYGICKGASNAKGAAYFLRYFLNDENYDMDKTFKNEECKELYLKIRDNADISRINFNRALMCMTMPNATGTDHICRTAISGTAAQLQTNLAATSAQIDASVVAANQLMDEVIANQ